jgi:TM2 domain-containing membrane protein YozV/cold shock CspA family protein
MQGTVLGYDQQSRSGAISGDDGKRYKVSAASLGAGVTALKSGQKVDFEIANDNEANEVFPLSGSAAGTGASGEKNKVAAGILAILLGTLGVHKFYLGRTQTGLLTLGAFVVSYIINDSYFMLLMTLGSFLAFILKGASFIVMAAIVIVSIIEGILYLTKSDADFNETYVANKDKKWL